MASGFWVGLGGQHWVHQKIYYGYQGPKLSFEADSTTWKSAELRLPLPPEDSVDVADDELCYLCYSTM